MFAKLIVLILSGARLYGLLGHRLGRSPNRASATIPHIYDSPHEGEMDDEIEGASELERPRQSIKETV
jgi:hypothetical protein